MEVEIHFLPLVFEKVGTNYLLCKVVLKTIERKRKNITNFKT